MTDGIEPYKGEQNEKSHQEFSQSFNTTNLSGNGAQPYTDQSGISVPNSTASLVLGILSILGTLCYGVLGVLLGIIALVLGNKAIKEYEGQPHVYSKASSNNAKAGKVCGIIGLTLGGLFVLLWIFLLLFFTAQFSTL